MSGVRIHEEISAHGFSSSYEIVKKYVSKLKRKENIFVRIHTPVGHEVQENFGYVGKTLKTWVINMRLNYSRLDYYEKIYEQRVGTFINCHINAFEYFRAIPEVVRIDNLKAAILEERMYKDFARLLCLSASAVLCISPK